MSEIKQIKISPGIYLRANRYVVYLMNVKKYVGSFQSLAAAEMELKNAKLSAAAPERKAAGGKQRKQENSKGFSPEFQKTLNKRW